MKQEDVVQELRKRFKDADVNNIEGTIAVQIDLKDDNYSNVYLEIKDKVLSIEPYDYYDRVAKITVDSKDLLDIIDRKLDVEKAVSENLIIAEGDVQKCMELLKLSKVQAVKEEKKLHEKKAEVQAKPKEVAKTKPVNKFKGKSSAKGKSKK